MTKRISPISQSWPLILLAWIPTWSSSRTRREWRHIWAFTFSLRSTLSFAPVFQPFSWEFRWSSPSSLCRCQLHPDHRRWFFSPFGAAFHRNPLSSQATRSLCCPRGRVTSGRRYNRHCRLWIPKSFPSEMVFPFLWSLRSWGDRYPASTSLCWVRGTGNNYVSLLCRSKPHILQIHLCQYGQALSMFFDHGSQFVHIVLFERYRSEKGLIHIFCILRQIYKQSACGVPECVRWNGFRFSQPGVCISFWSRPRTCVCGTAA